MAAVRDARREADALAKRILNQNLWHVTDASVLEVLRLWGFPENRWRRNVMQRGANFVRSDTLGLVVDRAGQARITRAALQHRYVSFLLSAWLQERLLSAGITFHYTSITLNCNFAAALHRDRRNRGPSILAGFGQWSSGRLEVFERDAPRVDRHGRSRWPPRSQIAASTAPTIADPRNRLVIFDGRQSHRVQAFRGERFSVIFWSCAAFDAAIHRDTLVELNFRPPSELPGAQAPIVPVQVLSRRRLERQASALDPSTDVVDLVSITSTELDDD